MDKNQALSKAMALCSRKECSQADIRGKLKTWGITEEDGEAVIQELVRQKFIDDLRFTIAYVKDKVRLNQWGRIKIRYMLSMAKVSHSLIDQAFETIDEDTYADTLKELLQRKTRDLKRETNPYTKKQKLVKFAQGRGFETELIMRELHELL
jgi:regulatory protein